MTKPSIENAHRALRDAASVMEAVRAVWHLDGGTLLGFWRDGQFCKDDHDDIDLTAFGVKISDLVPRFLALGFDIYHEWEGDADKLHTPQISFKRDNVKVDVMLKVQDEKWVNWTVYRRSKGPVFKRTPLKLTGSPEYWTFICNRKALQLPVPKQVEKYLAYRYGNWQVPIHRSKFSCYTSDMAIIDRDL